MIRLLISGNYRLLTAAFKMDRPHTNPQAGWNFLDGELPHFVISSRHDFAGSLSDGTASRNKFRICLRLRYLCAG
jgi:hypothetical protein